MKCNGPVIKGFTVAMVTENGYSTYKVTKTALNVGQFTISSVLVPISLIISLCHIYHQTFGQ